jgi:hypothetical protein
MRVAVEVTLAANLGPGRVDAKGQDGQKHIDDPDAEIFAGRAGKGEGLAPHRKVWRGLRLRSRHVVHRALPLQFPAASHLCCTLPRK